MNRRTSTKLVSVASLVLDPAVNQRPAEKRKVDKFAKEFDPEALGVIEVSERANGTIVVLDGQHRVLAARRAGWDNGHKIDARVHYGLNHEQECRLFKQLNDETPVNPIYKLMAGADAGDHPDRAIREVIESVGLKLGDQSLDGWVSAASAVRTIWAGGRKTGGRGTTATSDNPELLRRTLRLILASWGPQTAALRGDMLSGFALFLARYGNNADLDVDALSGLLAGVKGGPSGFRGQAKALAEVMGTTLRQGIAGLLVQTYNKKRRTSKLDAWWS